jgi:predicted  nucleic acid-binding Zn-ribbon protein
MDRKQDALDRKSADFEQTKEQLEKEKAQINEKLEVTRVKLAEVQDQAMQLKLESGREQALLS